MWRGGVSSVGVGGRVGYMKGRGELSGGGG